MPQVEIPPRYRGPTGGLGCVEVEGTTVRECLEAVERRHPGFLELVVDGGGGVRRFVRLFVNGDELLEGALETSVAAGDRVAVLAAAAGG